MYPKIEINLNGMINNVKKMKILFDKQELKLSLVVKVLGGNRAIVERLIKEGITSICDTHVQNLKKFEDLEVEKIYIREPGLSEIHDVVKYSDVSLNSEITSLRALNEEAKKQDKRHKVILMYELGHIREGACKEEIFSLLEECLQLNYLEFYGLGTNPSCYSATMPTIEDMEEFILLKKEIEEKYHVSVKTMSGGNSTSYIMLKNGEIPKEINELRMGESIFFGVVPCIEEEIEGFCQKNFVLKAEVVELKEKPSLTKTKPVGLDSCGDIPEEIEDKGIRKKALIAIGKQDVEVKKIVCQDKDVINLGGSSDYMILDVTDSKKSYKVGDIVAFNVNYSCVLHLMTSNYVEKEIIE